jgi:hypothetical protein
MAQSGFTPIQIYSSSTTGNTPAAGNLLNSTGGAELAINIFDGKLFYKDSSGNVQVIGWKVVPVSAGGTGQTSYTDGQLLIGNSTGNTLTKATLTAGTGVTITNGAGAITINATGTGGTVTSVAALTLGTTGTDLSSTVANGTTTPVITLNVPTASATNRGALSAADWTTFNNKTSNTGTVTSVAASVPSFLSISGSPITTSGTLAITLSGTALPTTSGGTGLTSFTANGVAYASSSSALATGSTFKFDGTNVGIGASTIEAQLQVLGASGTGGEIRIGTSGADLGTSTLNMYGYTNQILFKHKNIGTTLAGIAGYPGNFGTDSSGYMTFSTQTAAGAYAERMRIFASGGVSIGNTTDPGATNLSVTGSIASGSRAITKASMPAGSILQVVQTATSSIYIGFSSTSFVTTGLTASITPTSSTSKILVTAMFNVYGIGYAAYATLYRNSTNLAGANGMALLGFGAVWQPVAISYLDSPATTSSTAYTVYLRTNNGATGYFGGDGNQTITITLMEVAV